MSFLTSIVAGHTQEINMAKFHLLFCERCKAKLNPDMAVWLELDQRTGTYTDQPVPEEYSQGGFPFGADCARFALAEHIAAQEQGNSRSQTAQ